MDVRFLAADAPGDWMLPGRRFEVIEGARKVREWTVLAAFEEVPPSNHAGKAGYVESG